METTFLKEIISSLITKEVETVVKDFFKSSDIFEEDGSLTNSGEDFFKSQFGGILEDFDQIVNTFRSFIDPLAQLIYKLIANKDKLISKIEENAETINIHNYESENKRLEFFQKLLNNCETKELLTKKSLKFSINQTTKPKTNLNFSYFFNKEESEENKHAFIYKEFNNQIKLNGEQFLLILKFYSINPLEGKLKIEKLIKNLIKTFVSSYEELEKITSGFKINFYIGVDYVILSIENNTPLISIFNALCQRFSDLLKKFKFYINFNVNFEKSFEDLTYPNEGILRTFAEGIKANLEISSNLSHGLAGLLKILINGECGTKEENCTLDIGYLLALLNFNIDLQISKGDLEDSILWKRIPDINIFDAENEFFGELIKFEAEYRENMLFLKHDLDDLLKILNAKIQICLNSPFGMLNLKFETKGLLDTWQTLSTLHLANRIENSW